MGEHPVNEPTEIAYVYIARRFDRRDTDLCTDLVPYPDASGKSESKAGVHHSFDCGCHSVSAPSGWSGSKRSNNVEVIWSGRFGALSIYIYMRMTKTEKRLRREAIYNMKDQGYSEGEIAKHFQMPQRDIQTILGKRHLKEKITGDFSRTQRAKIVVRKKRKIVQPREMKDALHAQLYSS